MATIDEKTTERLIQICGMLGSEHEGERANAAKKATDILKGMGSTWRDLITGAVKYMPSGHAPPPKDVLKEAPDNWKSYLQTCLDNRPLQGWSSEEYDFLISLAFQWRKPKPTPRQWQLLMKLYGRR
jgi:hypothetical protein